MAEALKEAMADTTIKERHFLTPNVYSQVSSTASSRSEGFRQRSRSQHGAGGHGMRSVGISPGARAKARRAAARARIAKASRFMTRRRMDVRFAGSGTTLESAAASTAAACMYANTALAVIQCMRAMVQARRTRLAPQPMVEKRLERGNGRSQPHLLPIRRAQRGAYVRAGSCTSSAGHPGRHRWRPSYKSWPQAQRWSLKCTRLTFRIQ